MIRTNIGIAAISAGRWLTENAATLIYLWSAIALVLSIVFAGGYTISKVVSGYCNNHDALVVFGRKVRREVELRHWRYEGVSSTDEGLLLYSPTSPFVQPNRAVAEWNRGNLDALVMSADKAYATRHNRQRPSCRLIAEDLQASENVLRVWLRGRRSLRESVGDLILR